MPKLQITLLITSITSCPLQELVAIAETHLHIKTVRQKAKYVINVVNLTIFPLNADHNLIRQIFIKRPTLRFQTGQTPLINTTAQLIIRTAGMIDRVIVRTIAITTNIALAVLSAI